MLSGNVLITSSFAREIERIESNVRRIISFRLRTILVDEFYGRRDL